MEFLHDDSSEPGLTIFVSGKREYFFLGMWNGNQYYCQQFTVW